MPWGRLDDGLYDHPKLDRLGRQRLGAIGLWSLAISWCNRRLTDGFVPDERVALLGGTRELADRLVAAELFDVAEGGYRVHDFLEFNDSREDVEARRLAATERQRRHRNVTRDTTPLSQRDSEDVTPDVTRDTTPLSQRESRPLAQAPAGARPGPSRPLETTPQPPASGGRRNGAKRHGPMRNADTDYDATLERDGDDDVLGIATAVNGRAT